MKLKALTLYLSCLLVLPTIGCDCSCHSCNQDLDPVAMNQAIATIEKLHGTIKKKDKAGYPVDVNLEYCPTSDDDVAKIAGAPTIRRLVIWGAKISDAAADPLLKMPNLTDVTFFNTKLTNDGVKKLAQIKKLKSLTLRRNDELTAEGLSELQKIKGLQVLGITHNNSIKDADLATLPNMPNLKVLDLRCCSNVTDEGIKTVVQIPNLKVFKARLSPISNQGIKELLKAKNLTGLILEDCNLINDQGLALLANNTKLKELNFSRLTGIGKEGVKHLATLPNLEMLTLRGTFLDNETLKTLATGPAGQSIKRLKLCEIDVYQDGIAALATLPKLKWLEISQNGSISDEVATEFGKFKGLEYLSLKSTDISDDSVETLGKLTNLKELVIQETCISEDGFKALKEKLPNCKIIYE